MIWMSWMSFGVGKFLIGVRSSSDGRMPSGAILSPAKVNGVLAKFKFCFVDGDTVAGAQGEVIKHREECRLDVLAVEQRVVDALHLAWDIFFFHHTDECMHPGTPNG